MKVRYSLSILSALIILSCSSDEEPINNPTTPVTGDDPVPRELSIPANGYTTPATYDGMQLVWEDDFDGTDIDSDNWNFDIGTGMDGWGNFEAQYYRQENASIVDGNLVIEAKRESFNSSLYTSSRLTTAGKQEVKYGRIDVRAVMPEGDGMWPAIWMLGANFSTVGWPRCGEIDIMEMFGAQGNNKVLGTVHWDNAGSYASYGGDTTHDGNNLRNEYHVYSIMWDENFIRWYFDDKEYHVIDITPDELDEFREDFYFIINLAVGGNKGAGNPASTVFPQWMIIDYIRVFQEM